MLGWLLLRLNEATHLIYRPRKFVLPDGREVDSLGRSYDPNVDLEEDNLVVEKVSLSLVDDLTVGDAINLFSLHEAPYRPFLTYRARIAIDGPLVHAPKRNSRRHGTCKTKYTCCYKPRTRPNGRPIRGEPETVEKATIGGEKHNFRRDSNDYDDYNN